MSGKTQKKFEESPMPDAKPKYGEPWHLTPGCLTIKNKDELPVAFIGSSQDDEQYAKDAAMGDRIVACVNALAPYPDPTHAAEVLRLVGEWVEACRDVERLEADLQEAYDNEWCGVALGLKAEISTVKSKREGRMSALLAAARKMKEQR